MDIKEKIQTALDTLANRPKVSIEVGERLHAVLADLDASDQTGKDLAAFLRQRLTYGGSEDAREASAALHAALQTKQGRAAAGLKRRGRGSVYTAKNIALNDPMMWFAVQCLAGRICAGSFGVECQKYLGPNTDHRVVQAFADELLAKAEPFAAALETWGVFED